MKLWTMVLGLAIAGVVASSVFAQETKKRGRMQLPSFADAAKDNVVTKDSLWRRYCQGRAGWSG